MRLESNEKRKDQPAEEGRDRGDGEDAHARRDADRGRHPDARRGREPAHAPPFGSLQDGPRTDETDPGGSTLNDAGDVAR
jgi:hypothetical protein